MNYLEIILQGYFNENNREFLNKYFNREFEKAKKENYSALEFFKGCEKVIINWETYLTNKILERKRELYLLLTDAKTNKRKKSIEDFQNQLKDIRPDGIGDLTYTIHLSSLTNNRIVYNMNYSELLVIKKALYEVALSNYIDILNNQPTFISDAEKKECERLIFPFGLPYNLGKEFENKIKQLDGNFENTDKYLERLKNVFHSNGLRFFYKIKDLDRIDFIDAIEVQYNYKSETEQNMYGWLNLTYDLIIRGFFKVVDIEKQSDFKKWFNEKIKSNNKYFEAEIVSEIIGQRNNMNSPKTVQPCYHYIKEVLSKYQLTSIKATEMVNDFKGSFSPDWNKNVIPFVIDYLKSIDVNNEPQQSNKVSISITSKEPTLKQLALYHVYLDTKMNNDNAKSFLEGMSSKSHIKLKQHFDDYYKPMNRTGGGTDRENSFKLKLFAKVILMLKETNNKEAVLKAEKELKQFENNIA